MMAEGKEQQMNKTILDLHRQNRQLEDLLFSILSTSAGGYEHKQRLDISAVQVLLKRSSSDPSMRTFYWYLQNQWLRYASQQEWCDVLPALIDSKFEWLYDCGLYQSLLPFSENKEEFIPKLKKALHTAYKDDICNSIIRKVDAAYSSLSCRP